MKQNPPIAIVNEAAMEQGCLVGNLMIENINLRILEIKPAEITIKKIQ